MNTTKATISKLDKTNPLPPKERLQSLRKEMNKIFLERAIVIDGLLASMLAGQSAVLFGPTGCAKSYMLEELCRSLEGATFFNRLLHPAQTPDELLGQISLKALQERDMLLRNTSKRLPEAHIAFLDEIFRCNPATLNALLRLILEHIFENPEPTAIPLIFLCGAANDVPEDRELYAFVDRFTYRPWLRYVRNKKSRWELFDRARKNIKLTISTRFTLDEIISLQAEAATVPFPDAAGEKLLDCWTALERIGFEVGDRKQQRLVKLLQAYAFVQGDAEVYPESFLELLPDCLWRKEPKEREQKIAPTINQVAPDANQQAVQWYDAAKEEVKKVAEAATAYDLRPHADTKRILTATADAAATRLEDVARKIERLISQNSSRSTRRAARMLAEIREDLIPEVGGYKGRIYD